MNRHAALRAVGDHVDQKSMPLTAARARAISGDHERALHEDFDGPDGCTWWECAASYFLLAELAEKRAHEDAREVWARQEHGGKLA